MFGFNPKPGAAIVNGIDLEGTRFEGTLAKALPQTTLRRRRKSRFPVIPGSAELFPGSAEKIPGSPLTGIRRQVVVLTPRFLCKSEAKRAESIKFPVIFPVLREFRRAGVLL